MREKKVVKLENFNCFESDNKVCVESFYNFAPSKVLNNSKGIRNATFPTNYEDRTEHELNISKVGIESVEGIAYFKQYFPKMQRWPNQ